MIAHAKLLTPYVCLLGVLFLTLSLNVIHLRRKHHVSFNDNKISMLTRAIRAQGNFSEYTPFILVMLFFQSQLNTPEIILHLIASLLLIGRCFHAYGLLIQESNEKPSYKGRVTGMILTFLSLILSVGCLLAYSIMQ